MAKNVSKAVIEDMAYQLKRVGLLMYGYNHGTLTEENGEHLKDNYPDIDFTNPEDILDWVIENTHDVFATHDPSFNSERFNESVAYKANTRL